MLTELASNASIDHPLLQPRPRVLRAGVLLITSDRGLAGAYNANAIRTAEGLISRLRADNKDVALYVVGRKALSYYTFRGRPVEASWTGFSGEPTFADARKIGESCWRRSRPVPTTRRRPTARTAFAVWTRSTS